MKPDDLIGLLGRRPLLCDGGMGTQLMEAELPADVSGVLWNVDNPDAIKAIHQKYIEVGCDLITTNTFQGSRHSLNMYNLGKRAGELNRAAAEVARLAAGDDIVVLADVGPFGGFLEPVGDTTAGQLADIFTEQLGALSEGGADGAIIETMSDPVELITGVKVAKTVADWPVIATYSFQITGVGEFRTMMGTTVEQAIKQAIDAGADVTGSNCGSSLELEDYLKLADQLVSAAGDTPVILQPNAGSPKSVDGQLVYRAMPEDMALLVPKLMDTGVRIIGGCCGTTPEHLRAMNISLAEYCSG